MPWVNLKTVIDVPTGLFFHLPIWAHLNFRQLPLPIMALPLYGAKAMQRAFHLLPNVIWTLASIEMTRFAH